MCLWCSGALSLGAHAANFTCSWNDATADWATAADWSNCNSAFPNNDGGNTYDVTIAQGNPTLSSSVLPSGITIGSVTISDPGAWSITGAGSATVTGNLGNAGSLLLDAGGADGGGSLTIGGTLNNTKTTQVGPIFDNLSAATTLTLGGLVNPSGASFQMFGSTAHPVTLAFSPGGTGFTSNGGTFLLSDAAPLTLNTGFTNSGTFQLAGPSALTVTGDFANSGSLLLDTGGADGGGSLTIGGTLNNTKTTQVGPIFDNLSAATTLTLGGLSNAPTGTVSIFGSSANQAKLNITTGPANNSGDLEVHENVAVTTAAGVNLTNNGTFNIDTGSGQGASSATIGGTLSNTNALNIGNTALSAPTTVTAAGLTNTGTINLAGNTGNTANQAKVTVSGQASNTGTVNIPVAANVSVTGASNAYTQTAGSTNLRGGSLTAPNVNITGGILQGMGTITGATNISGTGKIEAINLANSNLPAVLTIDGNYSQSDGIFSSPLHGTGLQIDKVDVTAGHTVSLTGGDLDPFGVAFALGQEFDDIMTFEPGQLIGTFASILGGGNGVTVDLGGGMTLEAFYNNAQGNISLQVVPTIIVPGKVWNDGIGNWTTDPNKWTGPGAPQPTDDVVIGMTNNGNVTLNNDSTIDSLDMKAGNQLTVASGSTLTVAATPASGANGGNSVALETGSTVTLGGTLLTGGTVLADAGATLGLSGGTIMNATLKGSGAFQTNPGSTGSLQSVTISAGTTFAGETGSTTTLTGTIINSGTLEAAGGAINATTGFNGTGTARIDAGGSMTIGANSTVGTLTHNGTTAGSLKLGANNITVSSDYTNANFGTGNSFDKHANVATTGGQILAAGPNPDNMQVITGAKITGGTSATPTLDLGIVHQGDSTTYQIANQGIAGNPSLRGAIQTINGGNIDPTHLTGNGVTPGNFGPIAPGSSSNLFTVTGGSPGILDNQAMHIANNFDNVHEQDLSITGQINNYAKLALLKEGGDGILSGGGTSYTLDFGNVSQGSSPLEAMLAILNDNPLAEQQFTDLLSTSATNPGFPFRLSGCSVSGLPGGDSQSGCDIFLDTSIAQMVTASIFFDVESSNTSGYDQIIDSVTLTLEGNIAAASSVPEPGSMGLLASGLGVLLIVLRRERSKG